MSGRKRSILKERILTESAFILGLPPIVIDVGFNPTCWHSPTYAISSLLLTSEA
jgi:hypothetical protein